MTSTARPSLLYVFVSNYNAAIIRTVMQFLNYTNPIKRGNVLSVCMYVCIYTVNHKKRDILFLTITLANLNRFSYFYIILIVKKFYMRL